VWLEVLLMKGVGVAGGDGDEEVDAEAELSSADQASVSSGQSRSGL